MVKIVCFLFDKNLRFFIFAMQLEEGKLFKIFL